MPHIVILGAGPGGYVAAIRARQLGAEVTLIEEDKLGGTCLNWGCIPSKVLLKTAELAQFGMRLSEFGIEGEVHGYDWPRVIARKNEVVDQIVKGVEHLMKRNNIKIVKGRGKFTAPTTVEVKTEEGSEIVAGDKAIIATGSVAARLPLPGFNGKGVVTSKEILALEKIPERLIVIGAGYVGVEFADIFSSVGAKVTLLEMMGQIVPTEDPDMASELARAFRRRGVEMYTNAQVLETEEKAGKQVVRFVRDDKQREVEADLVLQAVGRKPNTEGLGLEELGVDFDRDAVKVTARMETNVEGLYAIGDAIGGIMLAHVASAEGKVAAVNAVGQATEMSYRAIPAVTFTHPEIGSVGLTEAKAKEEGKHVKVGEFFFRGAGKATAEGTREGRVKVVVEETTGKIIGAQICGPHATDLIHELVLAVQVGATAEQVADMVHAHPTLMEPIMEAAEDALGRAIHK